MAENNEQLGVISGAINKVPYHIHDGGDSPKVTIDSNVNAARATRANIEGTGAQSVTCGFTPTMVKITAYDDGTTYYCIGIATGTGSGTRYIHTDASSVYTDGNTEIINIDNGSAVANFTSFNSNGFTITWTVIDRDIDFLWEAYK